MQNFALNLHCNEKTSRRSYEIMIVLKMGLTTVLLSLTLHRSDFRANTASNYIKLNCSIKVVPIPAGREEDMRVGVACAEAGRPLDWG